MRKTFSIVVPMLALLVSGGLATQFDSSPAGARAVSDFEVADVYGGQAPVCGNPNPIACDGTSTVCIYQPCINIVPGTKNKQLGVVLYCSTDGSDTCGHVNRSTPCIIVAAPLN
jgi:hypothetical protein